MKIEFVGITIPLNSWFHAVLCSPFPGTRQSHHTPWGTHPRALAVRTAHPAGPCSGGAFPNGCMRTWAAPGIVPELGQPNQPLVLGPHDRGRTMAGREEAEHYPLGPADEKLRKQHRLLF